MEKKIIFLFSSKKAFADSFSTANKLGWAAVSLLSSATTPLVVFV